MIYMIRKPASHILFFSLTFVMTLTGCAGKKDHDPGKASENKITIPPVLNDTPDIKTGNVMPELTDQGIANETVQPDSLVAFAKTLVGIPYLYASTDPRKGFDCSGFITYVFNHFDLAVPRSSVDFTNMGREIAIEKAKSGDLILFTGTDSSDFIVGHMGIVENAINDTLRFIHSTSGKAKGVVISPLGDYYKKRFVKVIRVFPDELFK
jgi:cell wall-associated NlpC family hydrolase